MNQKVIVFLLLISQSIGCTQTSNKIKLDSFFDTLKTHNQSMGSIAIAVNGKVIYQKASGFRQINEGIIVPATVRTKYRVGSISKMFTATMIFQLIEEGKLSLETPLARYYPQLPNARKKTIQEMLQHSSGLHDFTIDSLYGTYMMSHMSETKLTNIFTKQKPDFEPNSNVKYSNTNFVLLGFIIEKMTGKTYAEELKKRVISKIGLAETSYGADTNPAKNESYSYDYAKQWEKVPEMDLSIPSGAGAVVSTPTDLVKFIDALFAEKLISLHSLENMKTMKEGFGMGMFIISLNNEIGYGHPGSMDGFSSLLIYYPENKLAMAYTSNGARYPTSNVVKGALEIYFDRPFTIPKFKEIAVDTTELDTYIGKYYNTQIPRNITITRKNKTLYAKADNQRILPLEAKGFNLFNNALTDANFKFGYMKDNFSLIQGGKTYLFTKVN